MNSGNSTIEFYELENREYEGNYHTVKEYEEILIARLEREEAENALHERIEAERYQSNHEEI